jgi:hypothetical protein
MYKKIPCKQAALSMWVLFVKTGGFVYWDFGEKNVYLGSVSWTLSILKVKFAAHLEL